MNCKNFMKRTVSAVLILMLFLLPACRKTGDQEKGDSTFVFPKIQAPDFSQADGLWYCNRFESTGTPPFTLPAGSPETDTEYEYSYAYKQVSRADCDKFISELIDSGFEHVKMKFSSFFLRDDCMVFLKYIEEKKLLTLSWYARSPFAGNETVPAMSADSGDSLSKIALHPIDVTPEGFYELTGGRMLAYPYYSFDSFKASGQAELLIKENNEWYSCLVWYVKGDTHLITSMESVAVCDIDGDNENDVLLLSYGPTSGIFTFSVTAVTAGGTFANIFTTVYYSMGFADKDGKLVIEAVGYDQKQHFFDIVLENSEGNTVLRLYENGEPVGTW